VAQRAVTFRQVDHPALVVGSTQAPEDVDRAACRARGVAVVRRGTGGGAVLLEPGRVVWADVALPAGDPLWDADVGRAFLWLGRAWAAALVDLGVDDPGVHEGRPLTTEWSRRVCFAGVGPGEVTAAGRKVVGMAQRRTREGALFQCAALLAWDAGALVDLLALPAGERERARVELREVAGAIGGVAVADVEEALTAHLPPPG
jgi:lipoate-protein ligase A